ncbi:MAG: mechanosensitive ion channel [Bacteroidaceae bacterium]|nr:mechanosensitive ion channel [Bacteroidaceae bacterium]
MKRIALCILTALLFCLSAQAVLKEKDLAGTLVILRNELTSAYRESAEREASFQYRNTLARRNMFDIMKKSEQNALMLYSQKKEYVFDLAYACHEATEQYHSFKQQALPMQTFAERTAFENARYDSLIQSLSRIPNIVLDSVSRENKSVCLAIAINMQRQIQERKTSTDEFIARYNSTGTRLKELNDYAQVRYTDIQHSIFRNGGENYYVLLKTLAAQLMEVEEAVNDKYRSYRNFNSEWDVRYMGFLFALILIYGLVSIAINIVAIKFLLPKRFKTKGFLARQSSIIMATTVITFAIAIGILKNIYTQNFFAMAGGLLVQYTWLISVIILSVLGRVKPEQLGSAYKTYSPLIIVSFVVIVFRIVLIPNALVCLIFPPIILVCAIMQWYVLRKYRNSTPKGDLFYAQISQTVFLFSIGCSCFGFTLLAVQALIWWTMQLTCILTITCIHTWLKSIEETKLSVEKLKKQKEKVSMATIWLFHFAKDVIVPVMGIISIMVSVYWAADVFNLSDTVRRMFDYDLITYDKFSLSLITIIMIASLWFTASFVSQLILEIARHSFSSEDQNSADSRLVMIKNVVQVLVWGTWFLVSLFILGVNTTWIAVIGAGLSTGVGFASKDIIENIYYGISLMTGRIKIGDFIECDGTRGRVSSISYTSTLIEAIDGSVIAFQNSQLFTKNYKNLTRNHGYVLSKISFGVAYGSNAKQVADLIVKTVTEARIPGIDRKKAVSTALVDLADSSVNFMLYSWVDVIKQAAIESQLRTLIYDTLNNNGISIPFPQQDIHIINGLS